MNSTKAAGFDEGFLHNYFFWGLYTVNKLFVPIGYVYSQFTSHNQMRINRIYYDSSKGPEALVVSGENIDIGHHAGSKQSK